MGVLLDRISARVIARTDFVNDSLEAVVETHTANTFALAVATVEFEAAAVAAGVDPGTAADAVLGLAEQFGESFPSPSADRRAKIKELVNSLVTGGDAALEKHLETVFGSAFDFEVSINEQNAAVDAIVPS